MLAVRELRRLASSLSCEELERQLGPFALVQRPSQLALAEGPRSQSGAWQIPVITSPASRSAISEGVMSMLFQFEELVVATLPPLKGVVELTVGRLPDCDLVIDDPSVSKRHAVLVWEQASDMCLIRDLDSMNGTYLNDNELFDETMLNDGDVISFGEAQFWYLRTATLHQKMAQGPQVGRRG